MRVLVLILALVLSSSQVGAQLFISDSLGSEDLAGSLIIVEGSPDAADISKALVVMNDGPSALNVGCRRIELDVVEGVGQSSALKWVVHHLHVDVGVEPSFQSPFDATIASQESHSSFELYMRPDGFSGCSLFRVEWFDWDSADSTEVLTYVDILFDHSLSSSCAVGLREGLRDLEFTLAPNPSSDYAQLTLEGLNGSVDVQVFDVLGQSVMSNRLNSYNSNSLRIDTSSLRNGIYFVAISDGVNVHRTLKLNVRH